MRKLKMLLAAAVVLAIGGVASASAQAAGTATVELVGTGSCDVTYDSTAWVGSPIATSDVDNIDVASGGTCDVDTVTGSGIVSRDTTGDDAVFEGAFHIETFFGLIECDYEGALEGTWGTAGSQYSFELAGTADKIGGGGLCPNDPDIEMTGLIDD